MVNLDVFSSSGYYFYYYIIILFLFTITWGLWQLRDPSGILFFFELNHWGSDRDKFTDCHIDAFDVPCIFGYGFV